MDDRTVLVALEADPDAEPTRVQVLARAWEGIVRYMAREGRRGPLRPAEAKAYLGACLEIDPDALDGWRGER
jgi:hypothetical protein